MQNLGGSNRLKGFPEIPPPSSLFSSSPDPSPVQAQTLPQCQEDFERWATQLVGRWWEIFWDPEHESSSESLHSPAKHGDHNEESHLNQPLSLTTNSMNNCSYKSVDGNDIEQQQVQLNQDQLSYPHQQHLQQQQLQASSIQRLREERHDRMEQLQKQNHKTRYSILCKTPSIGLSLSLSKSSQIIVNNVAPPDPNDVSNNYSMIRLKDVLVGVNGKTFDEILGTEALMNNARGPLHLVVEYLRSVERPMMVMFERGVDAASSAQTQTSSTPTASASDGVIPSMIGSIGKIEDENNTSDDDDDDGGDDIDWYDAKILSFNATNNIFTVHFLGDDENVTYEMSLMPKLVRPSVRVWTRRSLSLIYLSDELMSESSPSANQTIECLLPPSTDLPEYKKQYDQTENEKVGNRKLLEYSKLLEKQQYLATFLSPLVHESDADNNAKDDNTMGKEDTPGPLADANYIEHLCNCMKEIKAACDWIIHESAVLDILHKIAMNEDSPTVMSIIGILSESSVLSGITSRLSKEVIVQFLVSGSRFLNRLLSYDPESKVSTNFVSTKKTEGRRSRKKRRIDDASIRSNHYATRSSGKFDSIFDTMLTRALLADESLYSLVYQLLNNASLLDKLHRVWMVQTLAHCLSALLTKIWTPVMKWISTSEDMMNGTSSQFYSIEEIEKHLQSTEMKETCLHYVNLNDWTTKLVAKLTRARHYEAEALNAIKACTQPVGAMNSANIDVVSEHDECFLTLQRLHDEAKSNAVKFAADLPMKNINPLGKCLVNNSSGLIVPSPLTRVVIHDAIMIRRWVLDLSHANIVRERIGFVQSIITRYSSLPQLPMLPLLSSDGSFTNPSVMLENNTKDFMAKLSTDCYSYNHIIMDASTRLQNSMNGDRDVLLRCKEEVLNSLAALQHLPILSIVEEELHMRDELIDWNEDAKQLMAMSAQSKLSFHDIEALDRKLSDILALKSERRAKLCHRLKEDNIVNEQIRTFAVADQWIVCPTTSPWVREQHRRGSEWLLKYRSVISAMNNEESVDVTQITELLEEYDQYLAVKFVDEHDQLYSARQNVERWIDSVSKIVLAESIDLEDRCQRLSDAAILRPKGILVDPARNVVDLWIRVFSWKLNISNGFKTIPDNFREWMKNKPHDNEISLHDKDMLKVLHSLFAPLIVEGQELLISDEEITNPFLKHVRAQAIHSFQTKNQLAFSKKMILQSSVLGKSVLDRVLETKSEHSDSCLQFCRKMFWMMMLKEFISSLESDATFSGNMIDAKSLLLLSYGKFPSHPLLDTQADETHLQLQIDLAENLNRNALLILEKCTVLLRTKCDSNDEELREALLVLCDIQTIFNSSNHTVAVKLIPDKFMLDRVVSRIKWLSWLLNVYTYAIFNGRADSSVSGSNRIHVHNLRDLHNTIPNIEECSDFEIIRVTSLVKDLWDRARDWQIMASEQLPIFVGSESTNNEGNEKKGNVADLISLTEHTILSKVIMPEFESAQRITIIAREVQMRLKQELFNEEYIAMVDVNQAYLPDLKSLIASNGEFVLQRFIGSQMYQLLQSTFNSINEVVTQLPVMTIEKETFQWIVRVFDWVGSIRLAENALGQFVINAEHALDILEQGHTIFYSVSRDIQSYLKTENIGLEILPQGFKVFVHGNNLDSLGMGLLRWASFLFECLKSDVDNEDRWKDHAFGAVDSFLKFETESIGGAITSFKDSLQFSDYVDSLITYASTLIIQDVDIIHSLSLLREKMKGNILFQKSIDAEKLAIEERKLALERERFTNPRNIVHDRHVLLNSTIGRLNQLPYENDNLLACHVDFDGSFDGDLSVRDKSRTFLEKCLWAGFETLGFDTGDIDAQDFCSILAWDLEDAVFMTYQKDNSDSLPNEYRDKIRSLRFNLQDPKNPMLCAQVLSGVLSVEDLVSASTEDLASIELKMKRRQVEEEALKNVVLSVDTEKKTLPTINDHASDAIGSLVAPFYNGNVTGSPSTHTPSAHHGPNDILASIPPPPLRVKHKKTREAFGTSIRSSPNQFDSPPPSPDLSSQEGNTFATRPTEYILSQSGSDLFLITISRLKRSFTAKLAKDQSFEFDTNGILPSDLVEKGRLSIDEFNKFIHQKTRDGKWTIAHLKLASITGNTDVNCYKRFYKEYESLGRLAMIQVSDTTKVFLVTPKFLRVCKCLKNVENLSSSSTYAVILKKKELLPQEHIDVDDDMF